MPIARVLTVGIVAVLLVGGFFTFQKGWAWRQAKVALLSEGPVAAAPGIPEPGTGPIPSGGLLMFGDSRIAAWQPKPERAEPVLLAGYPGETAIRLAPHFARHLDSARPAAAFVQMGVNDAVAASLVLPAAREKALAASIGAFSAVAQAAEARGVRLTLSLVVPPIRPEWQRRILYRGAVDAYVEALNAAIPAIAARHGAQVVDPMDVLRASDGVVPDAFRLDALHWTPAAYNALERLLPRPMRAVEDVPWDEVFKDPAPMRLEVPA